jgi:hypothetical protein
MGDRSSDNCGTMATNEEVFGERKSSFEQLIAGKLGLFGAGSAAMRVRDAGGKCRRPRFVCERSNATCPNISRTFPLSAIATLFKGHRTSVRLNLAFVHGSEASRRSGLHP